MTKFFYCAKLSTKGDILMKYKGVHRITVEMCEARCKAGSCPQNYSDPIGCEIYFKQLEEKEKDG